MSAITTHVLDAVLGKPAVGVGVRLERMEGGWIGQGTERVEQAKWIAISAAVTDADGRCRDLKPDAEPGVYRLTFDTGNYLRRLGRASLYPAVTITFTCGGEAHYHLALLLSDNSYTTYRGS